MLTALTLLLLGADPGPLSVVATSKRPGAEAFGPKVAARVLELMKREAVSNTLDDGQTIKLLKAAEFPDPRACSGGKKCVKKLAVLLGPRAVVVSVDVAKLGKSLSIHLEAIAADVVEPLAVADVTADAETWKEQSAVGIVTFTRELKSKLTEPAPAAAPLPSPAPPRVATLTPEPVITAPVEVQRAPTPSTPSIAPWIAVGAGAAALVTSGVFLGLGLSDKARYDGRTSIDPISGERAFQGLDGERVALRDAGNLKFTVALSTALLGAALGGLGAWLFFKD
jgi:hypothetical protein